MAAPKSEPSRRRLEQNLLRTLWLGFFQVFMVFLPIAVPYFQSRGLSMQDVFVLQAFFGFVVLVCEVPSGYLADLLGRRLTLVVGAVLAGVGYSLLPFAEGLWGFVLFELCLGIAHSLISGADLAILYDTELALGRGENAQRQIVGRLYGFRTVSESVAALLTSALLLCGMETVIWVQAVLGWVPLALALLLIEPPGARMPSSDHVGNLAEIVRVLLVRSHLLRLIVMCLSVWSLTTFYAVWLIQKIWELQGVALVHFGWLWAGLTVVAALAGRYAHRAEDVLGTTGLLLFIGLAPVVGYLGLEHFGVVGGYFASVTFFASRGFGLVVLRDALNRRIPSTYRATANSLASFGFRGSFLVTGPVVGWYLDLWGMSATLILLAVATGVIFIALVLPLLLAVRALPPGTARDRAAVAKAEPESRQPGSGAEEVTGAVSLRRQQ